MNKTSKVEWPIWARDAAMKAQNCKPLWKDSFSTLAEKAHANEGQITQTEYPFIHIVCAKFLCEASGDDAKLFMKYLSKAGYLCDPANFTDPDTWAKS